VSHGPCSLTVSTTHAGSPFQARFLPTPALRASVSPAVLASASEALSADAGFLREAGPRAPRPAESRRATAVAAFEPSDGVPPVHGSSGISEGRGTFFCARPRLSSQSSDSLNPMSPLQESDVEIAPSVHEPNF